MAEALEDTGTSPARRFRSALLLVVMVCLLGAAAAGILGAIIVVGTSLIDQALG